MDNNLEVDMEIAPREVVMQSARQFAKLFTESPLFQAFERAYTNYAEDPAAKKALEDFQNKQEPLRGLMALNAVSPQDMLEIQRLQAEFYNQPSVKQYARAQDELIAASQEIGDLLSEAIGLDYGVSCRVGGCCG